MVSWRSIFFGVAVSGIEYKGVEDSGPGEHFNILSDAIVCHEEAFAYSRPDLAALATARFQLVLTGVVYTYLLIGLVAVKAVRMRSRTRKYVDVEVAAEATGSGETTCEPGYFVFPFQEAWKLRTTTTDFPFDAAVTLQPPAPKDAHPEW